MNIYRGLKKASNLPSELEFQVVASCPVGVGSSEDQLVLLTAESLSSPFI